MIIQVRVQWLVLALIIFVVVTRIVPSLSMIKSTDEEFILLRAGVHGVATSQEGCTTGKESALTDISTEALSHTR
jgi:hypothetical protein